MKRTPAYLAPTIEHMSIDEVSIICDSTVTLDPITDNTDNIDWKD